MTSEALHQGSGPVRLGVVSFLNSRPLIEGLSADPRVVLRFAVPADLAGLLEAGEVDAALVPVVDVARSAGVWKPVSDACIGSDGETLTVRVFSKVPPEQIEVLHVDRDSHTSVALSRLIWTNMYRRPIRLETMPPVERLGECESVLLIGDKVVTTPMPGFDHQIDLGEAWKRWIGLPFVFAVWAAPADRDTDGSWGRLLSDTRDRGLARVKGIATEFAPPRGWPIPLAVEYLTQRLMFTLTPEARQGMAKFIQLLQEAGYLKEEIAA